MLSGSPQEVQEDWLWGMGFVGAKDRFCLICWAGFKRMRKLTTDFKQHVVPPVHAYEATKHASTGCFPQGMWGHLPAIYSCILTLLIRESDIRHPHWRALIRWQARRSQRVSDDESSPRVCLDTTGTVSDIHTTITTWKLRRTSLGWSDTGNASEWRV